MCIQHLIESLAPLIDYLILLVGLFGNWVDDNHGEKWQRSWMSNPENYGVEQKIGFLIDSWKKQMFTVVLFK